MGLPVFAFEHNLSIEEAATLGQHLSAALRAQIGYDQHWLVWAVHATEQGYVYEGDEYWPAFDRATSGWSSIGIRAELSGCFERFHRVHAGVKPTGAWAAHFHHIAWPITNAVLPRVIQRQLASLLFLARFELPSLLGREPAEFGRRLASWAVNGSDRLRHFLQQEELVGHLARALLDDRDEDESAILSPAALRRILVDLEREQEARADLHAAREAARPGFDGMAPPPGSGQLHAPAEGHQLGLPSLAQPRVVLRRRPAASGTESWATYIELPNLRGLLGRDTALDVFLRTSRVRVAGIGTWRPGGWLLSAYGVVLLPDWPDPSQPILQFEREPPAAWRPILHSLRMSPGPRWLFRVGGGGQATEVATQALRPGQAYVLVQRDSVPLSGLLSPCTVASGVRAARIDLPTALGSHDIAELGRLGLPVARTVRVWPVGLPARGWDGEGRMEWLAGEALCLALAHDHPVEAFTLALDGVAETLRVTGGQPGDLRFVQLPRLPPGEHTLRIASIVAKKATGIETAAATLRISVRRPEAWVPGSANHVGFVVQVDPPEPTLDAFWQERAKVSVLGPPGREVRCCVELLDADGTPLLPSGSDGRHLTVSLPLPVEPQAWSGAWKKLAGQAGLELLNASAGRFVVSDLDLGSFVLPLRRDLSPIRWAYRREAKKTPQLRLIDESGGDANVELRFYPFEAPASRRRLKPAEQVTGSPIPEPGGLFVAEWAGRIVCQVASTAHVMHGFASLIPQMSCPADVGLSPADIVDAAASWAAAQTATPVDEARRGAALLCLHTGLAKLVFGSDWVWGERQAALHGLRGLAPLVGASPSFAAALLRVAETTASDRAEADGNRFVEVAARYGICTDLKRCRAVYDFASRPSEALDGPRETHTAVLERAAQHRALLRGARLFVLARAARRAGPSSTGWQEWWP